MPASKLCDALNNSYGYIEISHGTLRNQDLVRSMYHAINNYGDQNHIDKMQKCFEELDVPWGYCDEDETELTNDIIECLSNICEDMSPQNYYFGTCEGDGSAFGWWRIEDSE